MNNLLKIGTVIVNKDDFAACVPTRNSEGDITGGILIIGNQQLLLHKTDVESILNDSAVNKAN